MSSQPLHLLDVQQINDITVVAFTGCGLTDEEVIEYVGRELFRLVEDVGCRRLLLNFQRVTSMATHMLGELIVLHKKMKTAGGRLALCGLNRDLREVFEVTKLTLIFPLYDTEQEALQTFPANGRA